MSTKSGSHNSHKVTVVGAGLAGSEAAWQLAVRGVGVTLWEMRPGKMTPAHRTGDFAELVCSNSFKSESPLTATGLLKEELRKLGSVVIACARAARLPAGMALAVDRATFAAQVTQALAANPLITVQRREVTAIPEGPTIVATGPLTSDALEAELARAAGQESLYFFDAAAPIVSVESVDMTRSFRANRYGKGEGSYINCPMDRQTYEAFWQELSTAQCAPIHGFGRESYFQACMPVEQLARKGLDTLRFGPMKPVGLTDPATGKRPYANVQLRQDNAQGTLYNLVGFQTNLKWGEQERVFRKIPGLEKAEFLRYGVMHRNTFVDAPRTLEPTLELKSRPSVYLAGQLTGTEGYLESAASGLLAALNVWCRLESAEAFIVPETTALGSLIRYITSPTKDFQPMHVNFGLLPALAVTIRGKNARRQALADRAIRDLDAYLRDRKWQVWPPGAERPDANPGSQAGEAAQADDTNLR